MDLNKLDLRKKIVLDLKKELNIESERAQVILALDFSGSMDKLYKDGTVQEILERILPLALQFDDNGSIDFYIFETGYNKVEDITLNSIKGLAERIYKRYQMGGTNYAPVINAIIGSLGSVVEKAKGLLNGLFGSKRTTTPSKLDNPLYVIFITDGANSDKSEAEEAIKEASKHGVFFQFVGIGGATFPFLEKLDNLSGRNIDNANFFKVPDLNRTTDDQLYRLLLTEFPSFIKEARNKGMIK